MLGCWFGLQGVGAALQGLQHAVPAAPHCPALCRPHTRTHSCPHAPTCSQPKTSHTYLPQVDGPDYFQHPAGYLVYDPALPAALLEAAKNVNRAGNLAATQPHFNLVNYQLSQMRVAFALAQVCAGG